jgi:protein-tyrosine phosphatase
MFDLRNVLYVGLFLLATAGLVQAGGDRRHVPLDGQSNFRDLGGYETVDGRQVKWGEVFRSGRLPGLSDADVDRLGSLGVRTVVNFLTPAEVEHAGEDRLPKGVREIAAPIAGGGDNLALLVLEARKTGDFSAVPPELNADIHRILVKDAKREYAALLRGPVSSRSCTPSPCAMT